MQLRVAVNIGPVYCDEHGFSGDDVTLVCRMLDAQPLRRALSESGSEFVLIISDYVYDKLVLRRHSLADPPGKDPVETDQSARLDVPARRLATIDLIARNLPMPARPPALSFRSPRTRRLPARPRTRWGRCTGAASSPWS
jgi:hypothetical protein